MNIERVDETTPIPEPQQAQTAAQPPDDPPADPIAGALRLMAARGPLALAMPPGNWVALAELVSLALKSPALPQQHYMLGEVFLRQLASIFGSQSAALGEFMGRLLASLPTAGKAGLRPAPKRIIVPP